MPIARVAAADDLPSLLALFSASEVSHHAEPIERARQIWSETLARDGLVVFVSDEDAKIVSTCMLITAPNLLRGGRPHGMIENVVTHPAFQGRGHGRAVIGAALDEAWQRGCHQVLLQSGRASRACTDSTRAAASCRGFGSPMPRGVRWTPGRAGSWTTNASRAEPDGR
jgi:GNAT superfamily N-acetyltransferase